MIQRRMTARTRDKAMDGMEGYNAGALHHHERPLSLDGTWASVASYIGPLIPLALV